jgi:transcriptional regulator
MMKFMTEFPFATLISVRNGDSVISHLPLTPIKADGKTILIGHLARANDHWKILSQQSSTAIFHGPHTYITPKWYKDDDIPTWKKLADVIVRKTPSAGHLLAPLRCIFPVIFDS